MASTSAVRLMSTADYRNRRRLLQELIASVNSGSYAPAGVCGFLSAPKGNGVARFIPVLLTLILPSILPACSTSTNFLRRQQYPRLSEAGNWEVLAGRWRKTKLYDFSMERVVPQCLAPATTAPAWMRHWQEFWKVLAAKYEHADDDSWFAMFDIANFYDSVDLHQLETSVRAASADEHFAVNVIFHILASWKGALNLYTASTKGLPMDLVGDCSRLLANFFPGPI